MKLYYACSALILSALTLDASAQAVPAKGVIRHGHAAVLDAAARGGGPANDVCADITPQALTAGTPLLINGDVTGATIDDPPVTSDAGVEFPAVWEAFSVASCMDVTLSYCGSLNIGTTFTGLFLDCDFSGIVRAVDAETTTCPDGQFTITYRRVPEGDYYIPVVLDAAGTPGPYTITITGTACSDPTVANDECDGGISLIAGSTCTPTTVDVTGAYQSYTRT
jgi:hypothetical protein